MAMKSEGSLGVKIEAKFSVGEYNILILSAKDSTGLATWLAQEKYKIPDGAEPLLRPYVEGGSKFFVAKVDPTKVKFEDGRAALSPLRFHYDSDEFSLPIRLGMANSSGTQDLIVNILAPSQRYDMANYKNVTIPTNIDVSETVKDKFGAFYAALFDRTVEKNPGAVVTEYAWQATTCDPCPGPALNFQEFTTLGADVLDGSKDAPTQYNRNDFVLTRLHARYGKSITDDLRFKQAEAIAGGREHLKAATANNPEQLEEGAQSSPVNNFQGRYAIRHAWTGPVTCAAPVRHRWGGPPADVRRQPGFIATGVKPAVDLAFVARGSVDLPNAVRRDVPEIDLKMAASAVAAGGSSPDVAAPNKKSKSGCGCDTGSDSSGLLVGLSLLLIGLRRRQP
jgi:MYXO-CTERM domain-containing protein